MTSLTLTQANQILNIAIAKAREQGFRPMAVVVLDAAGQPVALQREAGASAFRVDVATGKAWAAANMGVSSRLLSQRAKDNQVFYISLAATAQGKFLAQTGAVVIKDAAGAIIGAVGASGGTGDEDELICIAGIEAAGLQHG